MSRYKPSMDRPSFKLIPTALRVWAVGFVLAAKGTMWLARKVLRSWSRTPQHSDETLIR